MKLGVVTCVVGALAGTAGVAEAKDSSTLVCSATVQPADGYGALGLFMHVLEHRAPDGESRVETVSTIYQGRLFQATSLNKAGDLARDVTVVMKERKRVIYSGTYSLVRDPKAGSWTLHLRGTYDEDPGAKDSEKRAIDADLPCVDLST